MKWHCGYLDSNPDRSRNLRWARTCPIWNLPDDVQRELVLMLNMPGFAVDYHKNMLKWSPQWTLKFINYAQDQYLNFKDEIAEDWTSITREDAMLFAQRRPYRCRLPLISKLYIADDKRRMRFIMKDYNCTHTTILRIRRDGPFEHNYAVPDWFWESTPH